MLTLRELDPVPPCPHIAERLVVYAVYVLSSSLYQNAPLLSQLFQEQLQREEAISRGVQGSSGVGEAEDDVLRRVLVQVGEQLANAVLEVSSEAGIVRLEEDADPVQFLQVGEIAEC